MKFNMLVVTDHTTHSSANSLYELVSALHKDKRNENVFVCTRGFPQNHDFFAGKINAPVYATPVLALFSLDLMDSLLLQKTNLIDLQKIDVVLIRMPQPLDPAFLHSLTSIVPPERIINKPEGTIETSSKEFLMQVPHLCPSPQMCYSLEQAIEMTNDYEIVLKPLYSYGGRGIVRLSKNYFWTNIARFKLQEVFQLLPPEYFPMLAMRYLSNVSFGDKRTIVVNREIVGSALRIPPPDSWICNVAQGGQALMAQPDQEELKIENELTPMLFDKGVIIYGFDTLVDDNGLRVLSEINTLSIGGLWPLEEMSGLPILQRTASLLWDYVVSKS